MAVLVHLTTQRHEKAIRRYGLKAGRQGLFALPVTPDFMTTHQWGRELKRFGLKQPLAVYFRASSDTWVRAGRYNEEHRRLRLGPALKAYLEAGEPLGFEFILESTVPASKIIKTKRLRRPVGWRFYPEAKGVKPLPERGEFAAAKTRRRLEEGVRNRSRGAARAGAGSRAWSVPGDANHARRIRHSPRHRMSNGQPVRLRIRPHRSCRGLVELNQ